MQHLAFLPCNHFFCFIEDMCAIRYKTGCCVGVSGRACHLTCGFFHKKSRQHKIRSPGFSAVICWVQSDQYIVGRFDDDFQVKPLCDAQGYIFLHDFLLSSCGGRRKFVISFLNIGKKMSKTNHFSWNIVWFKVTSLVWSYSYRFKGQLTADAAFLGQTGSLIC